MDATLTNQLSIAGLALDILGALFLAKGFMFKTRTAIIMESGSYWDFNKHLRDSLILQRAEAIIGGTALTTGFFLQALPYLPKIETHFLIIVFFSLPLSGWFFQKVSQRIAKVTIVAVDASHLLRRIEEYEQHNPGVVPPQLANWGQQAGVPRISGETDFEFLARIKQRLADTHGFAI